MKIALPPSRSRYPSDISREQFELILSDLENFRKQTKPRTVDLYDVFLWAFIRAEKRLSMAYAAQ